MLKLIRSIFYSPKFDFIRGYLYKVLEIKTVTVHDPWVGIHGKWRVWPKDWFYSKEHHLLLKLNTPFLTEKELLTK